MDIGQVQYSIWTMILSGHIGRGGAFEFDHYLKGKEIYPQKSKNLNRFTILEFHI